MATDYQDLLKWAVSQGIVASSNGNGDHAGMADFPNTDLGNAERLVKLYGHELRYCYPFKKWLAWDGQHWDFNRDGEIFRKASATVRSMYQEASMLESIAAGIEDDGQRESTSKAAEALSKWARKCEAKERINALISLAESRPGIAVLPEQLDSDPWLFNCANGTIDLKTGELKPHDQSQMLTKLAPVKYEPGMISPLWEDFLATILPDESVRAFVKRAVGYSITGLSTEERLFFPFGPAATGKSTFLRAIRAAIGDYGATADFGTFLEKPRQGANNDIARLAGKRMVVSVEVNEGERLAEALIQQITGGDPVAARFLYSESFEFIPTFCLWFASNNRPRVRDDNDANWRRILQIPFEHQIPEEERDDSLKTALCDLELSSPGVLTWAVEGCLDWQSLGLSVPTEVKALTDAYRDEMNPIVDFITERCVILPTAKCTNADIWSEYNHWAKEVNLKRPLGRKAFTQRLTRMEELTQDRTKSDRFWQGIGLVMELNDGQ